MAGKERQDIETAAQRETLQVSLEPRVVARLDASGKS